MTIPALSTHLGPPDTDPELERWTWNDDELGVFVEQLTHAWQTVAWTPQRSVTLRSIAPPTEADLAEVVSLAGLYDGALGAADAL